MAIHEVTVSGALAAMPDDLAAALGHAPVVAGEDPEHYRTLFARIRQTVAPRNAIEEIFSNDVTDLTWVILRLRRYQTILWATRAPNGVASALETLMSYQDRKGLAEDWVDGKKIAIAKVDRLLKPMGDVGDVIATHTLVANLGTFERLDRLIMQAYAARDSLLREIDRGRAAALQRVLLAEEIEDAEFVEVPSPTHEAAE